MITESLITVKKILDLSRSLDPRISEGGSCRAHNTFENPNVDANPIASHKKDVVLEILCRKIIDDMEIETDNPN